MRVSRISENRIDIHLSGDEMNDIFGGYEYIDYNKKDCRAKIHSLIYTMIPDMLLPPDCKKILIEVRPANPGCTISLTKCYGLKPKIKQDIIMIFKSSNDLISAIVLLKTINFTESSLFSNGKSYALICTATSFGEEKALHISEYCKISHRITDAAKIKEYWQPICKSRAIVKLASAFLK